MAGTYDIGDTPKLTFYVRVDGVLTDAASATLTITKPDGTTATPTPSHPATGTYIGTIVVDQTGEWLFAWSSTTPNTAEDGSFWVNPAQVQRLYATRPELKARIGIPATDTNDDDELDRSLETTSREIDGWCLRQFWKATDTRTFTASDYYCLTLGPFHDLVSVATLKTDDNADGTFETTWAASDYQLQLADGTTNTGAGPELRPYQRLAVVGTRTFPQPINVNSRRDLVQIVGVFGWPQIPAAVRDACLIMATELFALKDTKFGATGFADLGIVRVRDNPKAMKLLAPYVRVEGFA